MSKVKSKTSKVNINNTYQSISQFFTEINEYTDNRKISVTDIKPSVIETFESNLKSFKIFQGIVIYFGMCHIDIELNDYIGKIKDIFAEDDIVEILLDYISTGVDTPIQFQLRDSLILEVYTNIDKKSLSIDIKPINNEYTYLFQEIY